MIPRCLSAHEAAIHAAKLRVELSQSKREQQEYLKNVELARVLDKRAEKKRKAGEDIPPPAEPVPSKKHRADLPATTREKQKAKIAGEHAEDRQLSSVLGSIF